MHGRRHQGGGGVLAGLLLLAALAGLGAWNYQRNVAAEQDVYRPYRGYTDEALEQMIAAYEQKHAGDTRRYERATARRVTAEGKAYFDEQVEEFERVQGASASTKRARQALAESQSSLKLLEAERSQRARERDRVKLFFKRLLTVEL